MIRFGYVFAAGDESSERSEDEGSEKRHEETNTFRAPWRRVNNDFA
jgi:hypothetical protein